MILNTINSSSSGGGGGSVTSAPQTWVNPQFQGGLGMPLAFLTNTSIDSTTTYGFTLEDTSTVSSAAAFSVTKGGLNKVVFKNYDSTTLYYFEDKDSYVDDNQYVTSVGNVIYLAMPTTSISRSVAYIAGDNNEVVKFDFNTDAITTVIAGDTTLYNESKGNVCCVPNVDGSNDVYFYAFRMTGTKMEIRLSVNPYTAWSASSVYTMTMQIQDGANYTIQGAPIFDDQLKVINVALKHKTLPQIKIATLSLSGDNKPYTGSSTIGTQGITHIKSNDVFYASLLSGMQLVSCDYYQRQNFIFNAVVNGSLRWYKFLYQLNSGVDISYFNYDGNIELIQIGDKDTLVYKSCDYKDSATRTYENMGMLNVINGSDTALFRKYTGSFTFKYFMYNEIFNNDNTLWIRCKTGDKVYMYEGINYSGSRYFPHNAFTGLYPCTDSLRENAGLLSADTPIYPDSSDSLGSIINITQDCILCIPRNLTYSIASTASKTTV